MKEKGVSNSDLSEMTGLNLMTISNARRGKNITMIIAQTIAKALDQTVDQIWPTANEEETAA